MHSFGLQSLNCRSLIKEKMLLIWLVFEYETTVKMCVLFILGIYDLFWIKQAKSLFLSLNDHCTDGFFFSINFDVPCESSDFPRLCECFNVLCFKVIAKNC